MSDNQTIALENATDQLIVIRLLITYYCCCNKIIIFEKLIMVNLWFVIHDL